MRWLARLKWVGLIILGCLTACQAGGRGMQASEFFEPPMVELLATIRKGNETAAQQQITQTGLDLNVHGKEGITPLLWLVMEKDQTGAKLALKLGANPNFRTGHGNTAVNMVSGAKSPEWLKMMLDAGGDPNSLDHNKTPALFNAINEERWADIKLLVERGADVNLADGQKTNSAHYAAYLNEYEIAYWLIEHGAEVNTYSATGASLAWTIEDSLSIMSPQSPQYPWALKVKQLLQQRGVKFPPLSPAEVRERLAKGEAL
ncbi:MULTISPECIES: ankyrin repeat domain-containing protein [unclassified Brenneria]|uniref:ankyrin repeat domain-containing protein n=1 Tax=unclassified Brenneria TaxID=2634434 RepID=UPI0018F0C082|nr:ankyrin repeat domain-containing protein [Brenneria sp. L3-3C-1]MBJ7224043.1 ankyrin repeat domain-containing protein [Brenneria sp. L3-3C-1]MEE3645288.1 ankyrin repeat domain-containing protein [Brenneria sp. L3_3C_1]